MIITGQATRPGTTTPSGDAAAVHRQADGTVAVAGIDGIGHSPRVAEVARLLAETAARIAARRGPPDRSAHRHQARGRPRRRKRSRRTARAGSAA